jgi:predicted nucleic acid-binding protein
MKYLLDVNALLALGLIRHQFHHRVASWVDATPSLVLATCAITELGFVRVLTQAPAYGLTVSEAQTLLLRLKKTNIPQFTFISDDHDISHLPGWVKTGKQTTDGHLMQLASANKALLATLDEKIPGAFLVPV